MGTLLVTSRAQQKQEAEQELKEKKGPTANPLNDRSYGVCGMNGYR